MSADTTRHSAIAAAYAVLVKARSEGRITVPGPDVAAVLTDMAEDVADRLTAAVLAEAASSIRVYAARERATKAHSETDHAYWDGVGQAANLLHRTAIDSERTNP